MSRHIPVLLAEVVDQLNLRAGAKVIDCTLGDAGHSEYILEKIGARGKLLGIDADPESLLRAKRYLYRFGSQVTYVRDNFSNLESIAQENGFVPADGILLDLGWSTPQFKERGRGFSFETDEPLDMRYGGAHSGAGELTAADIVNQSDTAELVRIFRTYGEEKLSREIANEVVAARRLRLINTTGELVEIILRAYRAKLKTDKDVPWVGGLHPATKVFQALRITVNHELEVLRQALPQAVELLSAGGRLAVITFHSLEDRIVKQYFQGAERQTLIRLVNKKPITASLEETKSNPSARSAKLRVIEKI